MLKGMEACYSDMEPPAPDRRTEDIERFEEKLGLRTDPEEVAMELFRASMTARGLDPDTPPEALPPELAAELARAQDVLIPGNYMGNPNDRKD